MAQGKKCQVFAFSSGVCTFRQNPTELRFYVPLFTGYVISKTYYPANLLA